MGLSVTIITKNEELNLSQCMDSVKWADEIILVDSRSTDTTLDIAHRYTDLVFVRDFNGFSDQKQFALAQATQEWVLNIDADEALSPELQTEIRDIIATDRVESGFWMPRLTCYMGRQIRGCGWYPDYQLRLFRREKSQYPHRLIHERVDVDGTCGRLKSDLLHNSYFSFQQHLEKQRSYAMAAAEQMLAEGKRSKLSEMAISPLLGFFKKYVLKRGFQDGTEGFIVCAMYAYYVFLKHALLWDLQKGTTRQK